MEKVPRAEFDAFITGMALAGFNIKELEENGYWTRKSYSANWRERFHNIPWVYVKKTKRDEDRYTFVVHKNLQLKYGGYARSKKNYIEWPIAMIFSTWAIDYLNRNGFVDDMEVHVHENVGGWYFPVSGDYIVLHTPTGMARYECVNKTLWRLTDKEGTVK